MAAHQGYENLDLGPLEPLLQENDIMEIMVNGPQSVYVERRGVLEKTDIQFESAAQIINIIWQIFAPLGIDPADMPPVMDIRLPDNSRVNAVLPPVAVDGPALTIRRMPPEDLSWERLLGYGSVNQHLVDFLQACVQARINLVVSGGTGSGKTTILNALSEFIPKTDRVVVVEKITELMLRTPHLVRLEATMPNLSGGHAVTMTDLVANAQKMRPDRIITGEVQGSEAWDMLQVMSVGYEGSMFTLHATSPQDALERIEMMATASTSLPLLQIRTQMASAIQLIVQQMRLNDGTRKIINVTEVVGIKNSTIETRDIFRFVESGRDENGRIQGRTRPTGYRPTFLDRFAAAGVALPEDFFDMD